MLEEVWGRARLGQRIVEATKVSAASSGTAWLGNACSGCAPDVGPEGLLFILAVFVVVAVAWLVGKLVVELVAAYRKRALPYGARAAVTLGPSTGVIGTVVATETRPDPLSRGTWCVAFGLELAERGRVMLRDGATLGFDVALSTGERIRIPRGICVLGPGERVATDRAALELYLTRFDPDRGEPDPFPCNRAALATLRPGDRVEVLNPLDRVADGAAPVTYRESAGSVLVPRGIPRLRKHDLV